MTHQSPKSEHCIGPMLGKNNRHGVEEMEGIHLSNERTRVQLVNMIGINVGSRCPAISFHCKKSKQGSRGVLLRRARQSRDPQRLFEALTLSLSMSAPEARYPLKAVDLSSSLQSQKRWVMLGSESTTISFSSMGLRLHLPRIFAEFYSSLSCAATPSQPDLAGK